MILLCVYILGHVHYFFFVGKGGSCAKLFIYLFILII